MPPRQNPPKAALPSPFDFLEGCPDEPLGCGGRSLFEPATQQGIVIGLSVHAMRPFGTAGRVSASMAARSARRA